MAAKHPKKDNTDIWSKREIAILMQNAANNMDNLIYSFRQTALKIGRSCEACKCKYYSIRQRIGELPTLRRVLISRGFFMLSRHKLYIQGKNSARTEYQPKKLTSEQSENIIKNIG